MDSSKKSRSPLKMEQRFQGNRSAPLKGAATDHLVGSRKISEFNANYGEMPEQSQSGIANHA